MLVFGGVNLFIFFCEGNPIILKLPTITVFRQYPRYVLQTISAYEVIISTYVVDEIHEVG